MKTIKLEGKALETAHKFLHIQQELNGRMRELQERATQLGEEYNQQAAALTLELKRHLGLRASDCCHLDNEYLAEHGVAFVKTACHEETAPEETQINRTVN